MALQIWYPNDIKQILAVNTNQNYRYGVIVSAHALGVIDVRLVNNVRASK